MCHYRQYREGLGPDRALAILADHAGTQWNSEVVTLVTAVVRAGEFTGTALDGVGRRSDNRVAETCGCIDALPDEVGGLVAGRGPGS